MPFTLPLCSQPLDCSECALGLQFSHTLARLGILEWLSWMHEPQLSRLSLISAQRAQGRLGAIVRVSLDEELSRSAKCGAGVETKIYMIELLPYREESSGASRICESLVWLEFELSEGDKK